MTWYCIFQFFFLPAHQTFVRDHDHQCSQWTQNECWHEQNGKKITDNHKIVRQYESMIRSDDENISHCIRYEHTDICLSSNS